MILKPIVRGKTLQLRGTLTDNWSAVTDFTGSTLVLTVRSTYDAAVLHSVTAVQSGVRLADWIATVPDFCAGLPNTRTSVAWELSITLADGYEHVVDRGSIVMLEALS